MIASDKNGIGFLGYAFHNKEKIKPIKINKIALNIQNIDNDSYPLKRPLYIYTTNNRINFHKNTGKENGICRFISYYLSTVNNYANDVGYFPIEEPKMNEWKRAFDAFLINECQNLQTPHVGHKPKKVKNKTTE